MNHAAAAANDPALPAVLAALRARGIQVHPEWPAQCLEFVRSSTVPPPVRHADLERLVLDQYLLADLRHVAVPALLPHAASFDHTNLVIRNTVLQIMAIDEVGESTLRVVDALEALLAYNKAAAIGQPPPPPPPNAGGRGGGRARARAAALTIPRTMLKLYLTDGHTDLVGMEYQPMPFLSLLTPLGAKIRVQNARCSRGVLFLTPETTQLLGGEVEELKITMPDLIARLKAKIGLREHPNAARAPPGPVDRMANQFLIDPPDMADMEDPDEAPLPIASLADAQNDDDDGGGPPPPPAWPGAQPLAPSPHHPLAWPAAPPPLPPPPPPPRQPPVPPRPAPPRPAPPPPPHVPAWNRPGSASAPAPPRPPLPAAPPVPRPDPLPYAAQPALQPVPPASYGSRPISAASAPPRPPAAPAPAPAAWAPARSWTNGAASAPPPPQQPSPPPPASTFPPAVPPSVRPPPPAHDSGYRSFGARALEPMTVNGNRSRDIGPWPISDWPSSDFSDPLPPPPSDPPTTVPTGPTGRIVLRPRAVAPRASPVGSSDTASIRGSAGSPVATPPISGAADPVVVAGRVKRASVGGDARPPPVKRSKVDLTLSPPTSSMCTPTTAPVQTVPVAQPERVAFRCTAIGQTGLHIRPNPHNKKQVQAIVPLIVAPTGEVLYAVANEPVLDKFVDLAAWRATRDQAHFMPLKQGLVPALVEHTVYLTRVPDPGGVAFQTKGLTGRAEWELVAWDS